MRWAEIPRCAETMWHFDQAKRDCGMKMIERFQCNRRKRRKKLASDQRTDRNLSLKNIILFFFSDTLLTERINGYKLSTYCNMIVPTEGKTVLVKCNLDFEYVLL